MSLSHQHHLLDLHDTASAPPPVDSLPAGKYERNITIVLARHYITVKNV